MMQNLMSKLKINFVANFIKIDLQIRLLIQNLC